MKRVSIAEAKQTLPALVYEAERHGEIEITRRGKTVAYLVSAERRASTPPRSFVAAFRAWRERFAAAIRDEPLELPRRRPARKVDLSR